MTKLNVTWVKSGIGYSRNQRRTLEALGFKRLNQIITHDDSSSIRGMLDKVRHLVKVEEKADEA